MNHVSAGGRLVLRVAGGRVVLRALAPVWLEGDWAVPVLAGSGALDAGAGALELATPSGPLRCEAHLSVGDGGLLLLRPGPGDTSAAVAGAASTPLPLQRRQDVRGPLSLPLRGAVLGRAGAPGEHDEAVDTTFEGVTWSVSAGGLGAALSAADVPLPPGARLYVELELPAGPLVPAVLAVAQRREAHLHAGFLDIAPADRERLVRLVFAEERRRLAQRHGRGDLP